jgi:hypothetical protein
MYEPRFYRRSAGNDGLVCFTVRVKETDLYIQARRNLRKKAIRAVMRYRSSLERYIERHPMFLTSLEPFAAEEDAPYIVKEMVRAAGEASVGPMASVAGAIAECVGKELLAFSPEVIVENGGDIFMEVSKRKLVGVYAGGSPLTGRLVLEIQPSEMPLGICTSSGTVGRSLSLGEADAVIVLSSSTPLADAVATRIGNLVKGKSDIPKAIQFAGELEGVRGVVIIKDGEMGLWGEVKIFSGAL